jgi:hypothetical protein
MNPNIYCFIRFCQNIGRSRRESYSNSLSGMKIYHRTLLQDELK